MDNRPIGVFDSGVGGLTVVSALVQNIQVKQNTMLVILLEFRMVIRVRIGFSNILKK